ncbi:MAG: alpha/beta fold hydrolase [Spirochaetales bacterium]|nr:alpha/beta fold hydrolase [Spirochaetales bacterium]
MVLNATPSGGGAPLFFLHGFLGSGENWKGIARKFRDEYTTLCPDARNHGGSPHSDEMNYELMAGDLLETADHYHLDEMILLGHSMGGKIVMETALSHPERVKALIVVDIAPAGASVKFSREMAALEHLDVSHLKTRRDAMDGLEQAIPDRMVRGFFLKNLVRIGDESFAWRINMPGIIKTYQNVWEGIEPGRRYDGPVLFIRGSESNYIEEEKDLPAIRRLFPNAEIKTIEGAGHWVHSDKPAELISLLNEFLETL